MGEGKENQPARAVYPTDANSFILKEYDRVSSELLAQLEEAWRLEKFAIGGSAALMAWLITNPASVSVSWAWLLPLFFVLACAIRFVAAMCHIVFRLGAYLKKIEQEYLGDSGWGWERSFRKKSLNQTIAHSILWIALVALAGYTSYLGMDQQSRKSTGERYEAAYVATGVTSPVEIKKILDKKSKDGWSLVSIHSNTGGEVLVFGKK